MSLLVTIPSATLWKWMEAAPMAPSEKVKKRTAVAHAQYHCSSQVTGPTHTKSLYYTKGQLRCRCKSSPWFGKLDHLLTCLHTNTHCQGCTHALWCACSHAAEEPLWAQVASCLPHGWQRCAYTHGCIGNGPHALKIIIYREAMLFPMFTCYLEHALSILGGWIHVQGFSHLILFFSSFF